MKNAYCNKKKCNKHFEIIRQEWPQLLFIYTGKYFKICWFNNIVCTSSLVVKDD